MLWQISATLRKGATTSNIGIARDQFILQRWIASCA